MSASGALPRRIVKVSERILYSERWPCWDDLSVGPLCERVICNDCIPTTSNAFWSFRAVMIDSMFVMSSYVEFASKQCKYNTQLGDTTSHSRPSSGNQRHPLPGQSSILCGSNRGTFGVMLRRWSLPVRIIPPCRLSNGATKSALSY